MSSVGTFLNSAAKIAPLIGTIGTGFSLAKGGFGDLDFPTVGTPAGLGGFVKTPGFTFAPSIGGSVLKSTGAASEVGASVDALKKSLAGIAARQAGLAGGLGARRAQLGGLVTDARGAGERFSGGLGRSIENLRGLSDEVRPGFGALSKIATDTIRARREEAVGNLRESLRKRRVLGASFADSEIARADLSFAQEEQRALAEAKIQELGLSADFEKAIQGATSMMLQGDLLGVATQADLIAAQTGLDQQEAAFLKDQLATLTTSHNAKVQQALLELQELGVAGDISNAIQSLLSGNAKFDAQNEILASIAQGQQQAALFKLLTGGAALAGDGKAALGLGGQLTEAIAGFKDIGSLFGGGGGLPGEVVGGTLDMAGSNFGFGSAVGGEFAGAAAPSLLAPGSSAASAAGAGFGTAAGGEFATAPAAAFFGEGGLASGAAAAPGSTLLGGAGAPLGGLGLLGPGIGLAIAGYGLSKVFDGDDPPDPRYIPIFKNVGAALENGTLTDAGVQALIQEIGINDAASIFSDFATGQTKNRKFGFPALSASARARAKAIADKLMPQAMALDEWTRATAGP